MLTFIGLLLFGGIGFLGGYFTHDHLTTVVKDVEKRVDQIKRLGE